MANSVADMLMQQAGINVATDPVEAANTLAGQGQLDAAQQILQDVLKRTPGNGMAWFRLGQIHAARDEFKPAAQAFKRVISLVPVAPEGYIHLGNVYLRNGRTSQALQTYREGLKTNPTYALLHFNIGIALRQSGDITGAIESYQTSLSFNPSYHQGYFSLGNAYRDNKQLQDAEDSYRQAIALKPDYAAAHINLAGLLVMLERYPEAIESAFEGLKLIPDQPDALRTLSLSLYKIGRYAEGADVTARALAVLPGDTMLQYHMGEMLYGLVRTGEEAKAKQLAEVWKATFPDNDIAQHMAAAVLGGKVPERAGDNYVRETFDRFAGDFEKVLGGLGYRVPELLCTAIKDQLQGRDQLAVLDAGCGTGLCAPFLRPFAKTLIGVDLSGGMLAKAEERKIYDALHEAELGAFLAKTKDRYDVAVAADVFCYFGALTPSFKALADKTASQGLFGFTVEALPTDATATDGYRLGATGRYQHDAGYVKGALEQAGFSIVSFEHTHGREEMGQPVPCFMVLAKRA